MSTGEQLKQQAQAAETQAVEDDLLTQCIVATPAERDQAKDLIENLVKEAMRGVVKWDRNVTRSINQGIAAIDAAISKQLSAIMHHDKFRSLEGTWRGLETLVMSTRTGKEIKIKVMNVSKRDLFKDLSQAVEFDQSHLFKQIYTQEYDMPGGQPYGTLIGDYEFTNHPEDVDLLKKISGVAAGAFCPFISAASPDLFGFKSWEDLPKVRALGDIFESQKYASWNSFRSSEDSRFVTLTMPRVLARLPYGEKTKQVDEFNFEEVEHGPNGELIKVPGDQFCWMNSSYVFATLMTDCFLWTGWCTRIRGAEKRRQSLRAAELRLHDRRRGRRNAVPDRSGDHRTAREGAFGSGVPARLPLQADRLRGLLRRANGPEAEALRRPRRDGRDGQRQDFGPLALRDGRRRGSRIIWPAWPAIRSADSWR